MAGFQGYSASEEDAIRVFVRVRPPSERELSSGFNACLRTDNGNNAVIVDTKPDPKVFTYDSVSDQTSSQESIFYTIGKSITENCVAGYNGTVFAYGQTGTGKTYTMSGPTENGVPVGAVEQRGLIPRMFEYLFALIGREEKRSGGTKQFLCKASYLEIYQETIFDLQDPAAARGLNLREDIKRGVFVDNLIETTVISADDCYKVLDDGARNRHVSPTSMNRESSRSHSVFTLVIQSKEVSATGISNVKVSHLNLVDLAGSERQKLTDTTGVNLREAGKINKSLSALGNVIMGLVDQANGRTRHIAYRDSKLTFLLKDSLGGNTKTAIIGCVSPSDKAFGETLSTLKFVRRAKKIRNTAVVNEDTEGNVAQLQDQIRALKEQLVQAQSGGGGLGPAGGSSVGSTSAGPSTAGPISGEAAARLYDMEVLVQSTLRERDLAISDQEALAGRIAELTAVVRAKDQAMQARSLIIKLREAALARAAAGATPATDEDTAALRDEIAALKAELAAGPAIMELAVENQNLRAALAEVESMFGLDAVANKTGELIRVHNYNQELARHVQALTAEKAAALAKIRSMESANMTPRKTLHELSPAKPRVIIELEKWKAQMAFEEQESTLKAQVKRTREAAEARERELSDALVEAEGESAAARKEVDDLEQMVAALKLSHSVELEKVKRRLEEQQQAGDGADGAAGGASQEELAAAVEAKASLEAELEALRTEMRAVSAKAAKDELRVQRLSEEQNRRQSMEASELEAAQADLEAAQARLSEVSQSAANLTVEVADLKDQLSVAVAEGETARAEVARLAAEVASQSDAHDAEVMQLEADVREAQNALNTAASELAVLEEQHETLDEEFQFNADALLNMQKAVDKTMAKLKTAETEAQNTAARVEELTDALEHAQAQIAAGAGDAALVDENTSLQAEVTALNEQLTQAAERVQELEGEASAARTAAGAAEARTVELQASVSNLQGVLDAQRVAEEAARAEVEALTSDLTDARAALEAATQQLDERAAAIAGLQEDLEAAMGAKTAADETHEAELRGLMDELMEQETKNKAGRAEAADRIEFLQDKVTGLEAELSAAEEAQAAAAASHAEALANQQAASEADFAIAVGDLEEALEGAKADLAKAIDQVETLERQNQVLADGAESGAAAGAALAEVEAKLTAAREAEAEAREAAAAARSEADRALVKEQQFVDMIGQMEETSARRKAELAEVEAGAAESKAALAAATEQVATLTAERDALATQLAEAQSSLGAEAEEAVADLEGARAELDRYRDDLEEATATGARLANENALLTSKLETALEHTEELMNQVTQLKAAEDHAFQASCKARAELSELMEEKAKLEDKVASQKEEIIQLTGHQNLNQKIRHLRQLKDENNTLKNELVKAKRLNTRLASEVGKYQTMLGKENADGDTATEAELRRALQATYEAKKKLSSELEDLTQSVLDITAHSGPGSVETSRSSIAQLAALSERLATLREEEADGSEDAVTRVLTEAN